MNVGGGTGNTLIGNHSLIVPGGRDRRCAGRLHRLAPRIQPAELVGARPAGWNRCRGRQRRPAGRLGCRTRQIPAGELAVAVHEDGEVPALVPGRRPGRGRRAASGFDLTVPAGTGLHTYSVYALLRAGRDAAGGAPDGEPGDLPLLGQRTVRVNQTGAVGVLASVRRLGDTVRLTGWALRPGPADPPARPDRVPGRGGAVPAPAGIDRPDRPAGAGFDIGIADLPGTHTYAVYADHPEPGRPASLIGSRTVLADGRRGRWPSSSRAGGAGMTGALAVTGLAVAAVAGARGTWSPCGLSMVSAINPMSERSRGNRYWLTALWFVLGSLLGGLVLGVGAPACSPGGAAAAGRPAAALWIGVAACLVALAADRRVAGFQLPLHPRQVNELWLTRYRRWLYASGFGVQIGAGFATYIMTAATYLVVVLAALTGSPALAVATGAIFGLVRGLAVLLSRPVPHARRRCGAAPAAGRLEPVSLRVAVAAEALAAGGARVRGGRGGRRHRRRCWRRRCCWWPAMPGWRRAAVRRARTGQIRPLCSSGVSRPAT